MAGRERRLLPDGADEVLPPQAEQLEDLRRRMRRRGYRLLAPPLTEHLESLVSGVGEDLDLQTFRLTDRVSGRVMGIPADPTPQFARIDAHRQPTDATLPVCYVGPVLH